MIFFKAQHSRFSISIWGIFLLEAISKMSFDLPPFGGIEASFQIPIRLRRTCGLKLGSAAILNQNLIFEMT